MNDEPANSNVPESPSDGSKSSKGDRGKNIPAAGPHAKPELTDMERTPGAGTLPDSRDDDVGDGASS